MKTNRVRITSLIIVLIVLGGCLTTKLPGPPPEVPQDKFSLKGFFLGMRKDDARRVANLWCPNVTLNPSFACVADSVCSNTSTTVGAGNQLTIGGIESEVLLSFKNNELTQINASFESTSTEHILRALSTEYGTPRTVETTEVSNRFGAKFSKTDFTWEVKDARVTLTNLESKVDQGGLIVNALNGKEKVAECMKRQVETARQDL